MDEMSVNGPNWSVQLSRNTSGEFDIALVLAGHHFDLPEMEALKIGVALSAAVDNSGARRTYASTADRERIDHLFGELGLTDAGSQGHLVIPEGWPDVIKAAVRAHYVSSYCIHGWLDDDEEQHRSCRVWCKFGDQVEHCRCPCHDNP